MEQKQSENGVEPDSFATEDVAINVDDHQPSTKLDGVEQPTTAQLGLRRPIKEATIITLTSIKPKDWFLFVYMVITFPLLFIGAPSAAQVVWFGMIVRLFVIPFIIFSRYYLAVIPDHRHVRRALFRIWKGRSVVLVLPYVVGFVLDIIHVICGVYFYGEDGKIIANLYDYPKDFWDDFFKQVDSDITGVSVDEGMCMLCY